MHCSPASNNVQPSPPRTVFVLLPPCRHHGNRTRPRRRILDTEPLQEPADGIRSPSTPPSNPSSPFPLPAPFPLNYITVREPVTMAIVVCVVAVRLAG